MEDIMEKLDTFYKKLNEVKLGGIFGLLSISVGILGDIIAFSMFPGYNFLTMAVSRLCEGPGGIFFNIGNIFSGIFAFIFVNSLIRTFTEGNFGTRLKQLALICADISCISFIFLGVFCGSNIIIQYLHGTAAVTSWGFGFVYFTLYNILMLKEIKYSSKLAIFGFILTFPLLLLMVLFFLAYIPMLTAPLIIILPPLEWVNTISVILWYLLVSTYMIYKKF